jgi:hypothetical protein
MNNNHHAFKKQRKSSKSLTTNSEGYHFLVSSFQKFRKNPSTGIDPSIRDKSQILNFYDYSPQLQSYSRLQFVKNFKNISGDFILNETVTGFRAGAAEGGATIGTTATKETGA